MTTEQIQSIPADFPRHGPLGAVAGAQLKLLARKIDGKFVAGLKEEELYARYDNCADLVKQLTAYTQRKLASMPGTSIDELLHRVRRGVANKGWDVSSAEMDWIFRKVADQLKRAQ
jgi:hypothetical protein